MTDGSTQLEIRTPAEQRKATLFEQQKKEVFELAHAALVQEIATGTKYYELCMYIRKNKVPDEIVREQMSLLGFKTSRISEVLRVTSCSKELWDSFEARLFTFKNTLKLARANFVGEVELTPVAQLAFPEMTEKDRQGIIIEGLGQGKPAVKVPPVPARSRMQRCAAIIFKLAKKQSQWKSGDGWVLTLTKTAVQKKEGAK